MSAAPADRILEALAEPISLRIIRRLAGAEQTQAQLVEDLEIGQSGASRAIKALRLVGLVQAGRRRPPIQLRAGDELKQLLLAADRLAEAVMAVDADEQTAISAETRRAVIRPSDASARIGRSEEPA